MKNYVSKPVGDVVWVGIRIFGLYLLIGHAIPLLAAAVIQAAVVSELAAPVQGGEGGFSSWVLDISYLGAACYGVFGVYALFFGKILHRLLTRIPAVFEVEVSESGEKVDSPMRETQRLYRDFMVSVGSDLAESPKERHEQFRLWLAD